MRVVSLIAGITLLATGIAGLLGRRDQLGTERDRQLATTAELTAAQLDETLTRISAVLTVATAATDVQQLGDALRLPVCAVAAGASTCSAPAEAPAAAASAALDAAAGAGRPVFVVAPAPGAPATDVVVAIDQGERLLHASTRLDVAGLPAGTTAGLVPVAGEPLLRARTTGKDRSFAVPSTVDFEDGPWAVRTTTSATTRMTAEERWLIGAQLAVGTVLAALALGGMIAEHRALQRRATTDALTGLPNRAEFERRAIETLARLGRDGGRACLMVIDLDQFKLVNDTVGHDAGDRVLVAAAGALRGAVRETDIVGRWGGDEFVVLMPGIADARSVPDRAAMIARAIASAPAVDGHELTASVGAALFPVHGATLEHLLRAADRAMYAAKVHGVPHHLAEEV
jgi:diguanylate cyclase (GGDEF)-like protein